MLFRSRPFVLCPLSMSPRTGRIMSLGLMHPPRPLFFFSRTFWDMENRSCPRGLAISMVEPRLSCQCWRSARLVPACFWMEFLICLTPNERTPPRPSSSSLSLVRYFMVVLPHTTRSPPAPFFVILRHYSAFFGRSILPGPRQQDERAPSGPSAGQGVARLPGLRLLQRGPVDRGDALCAPGEDLIHPCERCAEFSLCILTREGGKGNSGQFLP